MHVQCSSTHALLLLLRNFIVLHIDLVTWTVPIWFSGVHWNRSRSRGLEDYIMASCGRLLLSLALFASACLVVGARPPNFVVFLADE